MAPLDKKRLRSSKGCSGRGGTEGGNPTRGPLWRGNFIGVNVIYNKFWTTFTDYVGANINPFCSQVLAGLPREDESLKGKVLRFRGRHAL